MVLDLTAHDKTQGYPKVLHGLFEEFATVTKERYFPKEIEEKERTAMTYNIVQDFIAWLAKGSMPNVVVPKINKLQNNIAAPLAE